MKTTPSLAVPTCQCLLAIVSAIALAGVPQFASGGVVNTITWESAQNISSDSDVRTRGSLVVGFNVGATGVSGTTVNTVPFAAFAVPRFGTQTTGTISNVFFRETDPNFLLYGTNDYGTGATPFSSLSAGYQTLLSSYGFSQSADTFQVSVGGLTVGQQYLIQAWFNTSAAYQPNATTRLSGLGDSGNYVDLRDNTANAVGGLGQYAVGTFTAASSTLVLELNGQYNGQGFTQPRLNAFQVRAVPEPSTYVLAGIGVAVMGLARCRNRRWFTRWTSR